MTEHKITLQTNGKYCGKDCDKKKQDYCYEFMLEAHYPTKLKRNSKGVLRCQACFDSEIKEPVNDYGKEPPLSNKLHWIRWHKLTQGISLKEAIGDHEEKIIIYKNNQELNYEGAEL